MKLPQCFALRVEGAASARHCGCGLASRLLLMHAENCEKERRGESGENGEIPNKDREKAEMSYSPSHFTFSPSVGI